MVLSGWRNTRLTYLYYSPVPHGKAWMPVTFGQWLKTRREMRGLSMNALGQKVGITHSHISNIESGKSEPHKDTVVAIAEALEVDPQEALRAFIGDPEITRERINDPDEVTLVEGYRRLGDKEKRAIKSLIEQLDDDEQEYSIGGGHTENEEETEAGRS